MRIKAVVIDGVQGDVEITSTSSGAMVTRDHAVLCEVGRLEDRDARLEKAIVVAKYVYGVDRRGRPNATNSMIHDLCGEIERVARC